MIHGVRVCRTVLQTGQFSTDGLQNRPTVLFRQNGKKFRTTPIAKFVVDGEIFVKVTRVPAAVRQRSTNGPTACLPSNFEQFPQVKSLQACYNPIRYFKARCEELTKIGGGCATTFGGTSVLAVACLFNMRGYGEKEVPPRGWRNLPLAEPFAGTSRTGLCPQKNPGCSKTSGGGFRPEK